MASRMTLAIVVVILWCIFMVWALIETAPRREGSLPPVVRAQIDCGKKYPEPGQGRERVACVKAMRQSIEAGQKR